MKNKLRLILLIALTCLLCKSHCEAAGPYWRVWLHEVGGRHLTMVNDNWRSLARFKPTLARFEL